jgi:N-acetylneuraminic acid mutarotase
MLVFGRGTSPPDDQGVRVFVGVAYDPAADTWSRLPDVRSSNPYGYSTVWTGEEMLVLGLGEVRAYDPLTNRWRRRAAERKGGAGGLVVWTGRELIDWGGGCCGDASSSGGAYDPAANTWRTLASSPLHPSQRPVGAWTGRELIVFVGGNDPATGDPWPADLARAAAYNPTTDTWRRIAPLPAPRDGAAAVWDGREVLVVGGAASPGGPLARVGFAYNPATNRWRRLPSMESGRTEFAAVWTGKRLLIWGGRTTRGGPPQRPPRGFAYNPATNRWSRLAEAPLPGRLVPAAVWTGRVMIVWGGGIQRPPYEGFTDGAAFTPTTR